MQVSFDRLEDAARVGVLAVGRVDLPQHVPGLLPVVLPVEAQGLIEQAIPFAFALADRRFDMGQELLDVLIVRSKLTYLLKVFPRQLELRRPGVPSGFAVFVPFHQLRRGLHGEQVPRQRWILPVQTVFDAHFFVLVAAPFDLECYLSCRQLQVAHVQSHVGVAPAFPRVAGRDNDLIFGAQPAAETTQR